MRARTLKQIHVQITVQRHLEISENVPKITKGSPRLSPWKIRELGNGNAIFKIIIIISTFHGLYIIFIESVSPNPITAKCFSLAQDFGYRYDKAWDRHFQPTAMDLYLCKYTTTCKNGRSFILLTGFGLFPFSFSFALCVVSCQNRRKQRTIDNTQY